MINRKNYEIWFFDYIEGNLSEEQRKAVDQFVMDNPDLKIELELMSEMVLPEEEITMLGKDRLKRNDEELPRINLENFEEYLVLKIDGELTGAEEEALNDFLGHHQEKEKDLTAFQLTVLPEEHYSFPHKKALKRHTGSVKPLWYMIPAAAAATLVFFLSLPSSQDSAPGMMAQQSNVQQNLQATTTGPGIISLAASLFEPVVLQSEEMDDEFIPVTNNFSSAPHDLAVLPDRKEIKQEDEKKKEHPDAQDPDLNPVDKNNPNVKDERIDQTPQDSVPSFIRENPIDITDPGTGDDDVAMNNASSRRPGMLDLSTKEGWMTVAEKGLEAVTGKDAEIVASNTDSKKGFHFKLGNFEVSRTKSK